MLFRSSSGASGGTPQGEWRSQPVAPSRRGTWLKFETAGDLGSAGLSLELRAAADGSLLDTVRPSRIPGDAWRSAYVPAPRIPYVVVASDRDSARWFAFSGPAEMGPLSYWAWQATKHSLLLLWASLAATLGVALFAWIRRPPPPPAPVA